MPPPKAYPTERRGRKASGLPPATISPATTAGSPGQAWEETHGNGPGSLAGLAATTARTLLRNRAAKQDDRAMHAFTSGLRAGRGQSAGGAPAASAAPGLRLFVRQPLTESGDE